MAGCTIPTESQMQAVRRAAAASEPRTHALIALAANLGLRAGCLSQLRWGDVMYGTVVKPLIRVPRAIQKGGRGAYKRAVRTLELPINDEAKRALERFAAARLANGPVHNRAPLFPSRKGGAITRWQVNHLVQGVFARAGLCGMGAWGVHSLRKLFARRLLAVSPVSNMQIPQAALGHSRLAITEIYIAVDMDDVAAAVQAIGKGDPSTCMVPGAAFRSAVAE